jgi:hypothetical protein
MVLRFGSLFRFASLSLPRAVWLPAGSLGVTTQNPRRVQHGLLWLFLLLSIHQIAQYLRVLRMKGLESFLVDF